eukprot:39217-Alexandrium_andersonii.AAC.1
MSLDIQSARTPNTSHSDMIRLRHPSTKAHRHPNPPDTQALTCQKQDPWSSHRTSTTGSMCIAVLRCVGLQPYLKL